MEGSRERTVAQRSMSVLRKFTWTLIHAPPQPSPPVHIFTYRQPQRSIFFLRKFTWTLMHAPPHPNPTLQLRCVPLTRNVNMPHPTPTLEMHWKSTRKTTSCHGRAAVGVQLHGPMLCAHKWMGMPCQVKTRKNTVQYISNLSGP